MENEKGIELKPNQQDCVDFDADKDLLVRGIAGSGKSLVLIRRAVGLAKKHKMENPRIALLTYTKSLVSYTSEVRDCYPEYKDNIDVSTVDAVLWQLHKDCYNGHHMQYMSNLNIKQIFLQVISAVQKEQSKENRFLTASMADWVKDEIGWIRQRADIITCREDYLKCTRTGRGVSVRPTQSDRELLYSVYEQFYQKLTSKGLHEVEDTYAKMVQNRQKISNEFCYDYVLVDECQDLSLSQLKLLKAISRKSLTLAADYAQKIYPSTGFSWKELGIDIRGNASKKLPGTFRNTCEILMLAESIKERSDLLKAMQEETIKADLPPDHGPKPVIHCLEGTDQEEHECIKKIHAIFQARPNETIGILLTRNNRIKHWEYVAKKAGLSYETISKDTHGKYSLLSPGIKFITYHSAKGLEFDNVLLPEVNSDCLPMSREEMEEDQKKDIMDQGRSLFYVGMTRARRHLHIYCSRSVKKQPSPLIYELDSSYYESDGL